MLEQLTIVGALGVVLNASGGDLTTVNGTSAEPVDKRGGGGSSADAAAAPSGYAVDLFGRTFCLGEPRGVRCDYAWPKTGDVESASAGDGAAEKLSLRLFDREICLGAPASADTCDLHFGPPTAGEGSAT
jgi:hypothetical protein